MIFKGTIQFYGEEYDIEVEKRIKLTGNVYVVGLFDESLVETVSSDCLDVYEIDRKLEVKFLKPPDMKYIDLTMSIMDEVQKIVDEGLL